MSGFKPEDGRGFFSVNAASAPAPQGGYVQAFGINRPKRLVFISGQIPEGKDGLVPEDFAGQCRLVWAHLLAQLNAAGLGLDHLVKVTTFLADRKYGDENGRIRREILGDWQPALTVVIAGIFNEAWLVEIEAIAAEYE